MFRQREGFIYEAGTILDGSRFPLVSVHLDNGSTIDARVVKSTLRKAGCVFGGLEGWAVVVALRHGIQIPVVVQLTLQRGFELTPHECLKMSLLGTELIDASLRFLQHHSDEHWAAFVTTLDSDSFANLRRAFCDRPNSSLTRRYFQDESLLAKIVMPIRIRFENESKMNNPMDRSGGSSAS